MPSMRRGRAGNRADRKGEAEFQQATRPKSDFDPLRALLVAPYVTSMKDNQTLTASPGKSHEDLFASVSPEARQRLEKIQAIVEQRVADTKRCVSYGMPAFRKEKVFFYFASFKKHIGVYPPVTQPEALVDELGPYRGPKGNLIFSHSEPLPIELIGRVAEALARQYSPGGQG